MNLVRCALLMTLAAGWGCGSVTSAVDGGGEDDGGEAEADAAAPEADAAADAAATKTDAATEADAGPATNLIFATSTKHAGDLGGLAGADEICAARAEAAGLPGNYVAWISTASTDARQRLGAARGWVRPDGKPFADTVDELVAGAVLYPVRLDETGADLVSANVWTGTAANGTLAGETCTGWTSVDSDQSARVGALDAGTVDWTSLGDQSCDTARHLLCMGIDHATPVTVESAGRLAFVSTNQTPASAGVESFDDLCQQEADAEGHSGAFSAAIATSGATIADRFDLGGAPWHRPDGVQIAAEFASEPLDAPIVQEVDGTYVSELAWTGSAFFGDAGSQTCNDWSAAINPILGFAHPSSRTASPSARQCGKNAPGQPVVPTMFRVFCFQE